MSIAPPYRYIGQSILRREGREKVTGASRYVDDNVIPDCLHGKTIRSTIAKGRIVDISFGEGIPWDEFIIATAKDLPRNVVVLIEQDQPALVEEFVQHKHEPILLLAHKDAGLLEDAARAITITYEEDKSAAFEIGEGSLQKEYLIEEGDIEKTFAECDVVFEEVYRTGAQEHVYIEPNGFVGWWDGDNIHLRGSHQCPYYVHKAVKTAFGLKDDRQVDILQETTGGAFGGKEDFPSTVAIHTALLARKAGRPVRMIYDRAEDMACSTKRHPSETRLRIGCTKDGKLKALDCDFRIDGGAYITLSPVVLSRGILHGSGPYKWEAARLVGKSYATNSPPYGAFRGFGAPQSLFAIESAMSALAEKLGMCPVEFRRKNFLKKGDVLPTGQALEGDPMLDAIVDKGLQMADYWNRAKKIAPIPNRGIGLSVFLHGTGFTGSGEVYLASRVALATRGDGKVEVRVSSTEMGQGTETIFPQIAAEVLGLEVDDVLFVKPQTSKVPNSGPTVASRTCSVVGRLVERAAHDLKGKLNGTPIADYHATHGETLGEAKYQAPPGLYWDDEKYRGSAYGAYSWGINIAEVTIDPVTMHPTVENFWGVYDIGTVINPTLAKGQVEGGIAQGIGWATCENVVLEEGAMINTHMTNYIIPTTMDAPPIMVDFIENPYEYGGFGSKGVGEIPMDGPGPAVLNAVSMALRRPLNKIPIIAEELLDD
ncbi:MAG: xanthine dehydrogenase family protein [Candidatus Sumerlaeia bacterium]|nr:xanthine dehydrogenase family protein [Candidatus Sumerlaeia bacterium]